MKRILFPVEEGNNSAGNVARDKKEDDELRKSDYWKWSLKHLDARREKEKQEPERWDREISEKEVKEEDDEDDEDNEEDDEDDEEERDLKTPLARVRMEQILNAGETDRLGRRYDADGDLIPEPEPDFWTTGEVEDVPPQREEERRIRLERSQRTGDRRKRKTRP